VPRDIHPVWQRIVAHEGQAFTLTRGQVFTYEVLGNYLRPAGRVRHLSKTNFQKALQRVPFVNTASVGDLQGPSYVFAILMDERIRAGNW
jgi:hypothetical protein